MSQQRISGCPGRSSKTSSGTARGILFVGAVLGIWLAGALPAWAQGEPIAAIPGIGDAASFGAYSWAHLTFASVVSVLAVWIASSVMLRVAGRMHWVTRYRQNRLARALQVALGGLLLMAVLLPYLVEHHPIVALLLPVMGIFALLAVSMRTDNLADQNPSI